ncbi:ABC transporter ATP-binding protein, partial [Streptomyces sp. NPDC006386]
MAGAVPGRAGGAGVSDDRPAPVLRAEGLVKTHHGEGAPAHAVRGVDLCVRQG